MFIQLKNFITENLSLIDENTKESWEEIYYKLGGFISSGELTGGEFTEIILDSGINDPASIMGYIPARYLQKSNISTYKIPNGITSINCWALSQCSSLTSVVIPDSVTTIDNSVFAYCYNLTNVVIGNGVISIDESVFYKCSKLKEIHYKGTKKQAINKLKVRNKKWRWGSSIEKIICTDGVIEL